MGKLIGTIKKSYFIEKTEILTDLNTLINNNYYLKGEISSNNITIESKETYKFNTYEKPVYTVKGKIKPFKNGTNIDLKIGTYSGEELTVIGMILLTIIGAGISIYNNFHPILTRKGEYFDIGIGIVFLMEVFGLYKIYKRKKQGETEIEKLITELKNVC